MNVITELIIGYMQPGRPVAMMLFKSWGYMMAYNGLNYVSDMKIGEFFPVLGPYIYVSLANQRKPFAPPGHYMKIPPRTMFNAQLFAVLWLSLVQIATYNFLRGNIKGICTSEQAEGLTCPNAKTFYNASVIWGVVGPKRMFCELFSP